MGSGEVVVLFSGGTDSTCAAALLAERFRRVHLLTFREEGTRGACLPGRNVEALRNRFGRKRFSHRLIGVDRLLRKISYDRYGSYVRRHGFFMLSTCGFSSLCWHVHTIAYCLERGIRHAADGLTRELMHFPGHMDGVLEELRGLYREFGIEYSNPVRDWDVPPDQQFLDRLIVDRHAEFPQALERWLEPGPARPESGVEPRGRTTGRYLYQLGLMPHPNVKGSALDRSMQHDCYPFVLFNIFAFWYYLSGHDYAQYAERMRRLFQEKIADLRPALEEYRERGPRSVLASLMAAPQTVL